MPSTVSVGRFATMTHLSVKTLRHYHQVGLLEPAEIDPYTGYRYYTLDQLPTAQLIRRLRDLRMPVADVRAVLAASSPHERDTLIAAHIDHLETELAKTQSAVESLRALLEGAPGQHPVHRAGGIEFPSCGNHRGHPRPWRCRNLVARRATRTAHRHWRSRHAGHGASRRPLRRMPLST